MASPRDNLAGSLARLRAIQAEGRRVLKSSELSRAHRERLLRSGFLQQVIPGWLMCSSPDVREGDTTTYSS